MHAAKAETLILLSLVLALSGCYGFCADPYAGCGPGGYGGYDDCVGLSGAGYDYGYGEPCPNPYGGGYGPAGYRDRPSLRERMLARREARALRRDARRGGYRHGRRGNLGSDAYFDPCCDGGWVDPCCGFECGSCYDCGPCCDPCGPCIEGCVPMSTGCSGCDSCSDCGTYGGGFETYDSGVVDPGMMGPGIIESPEMSCASGNCPMGPGPVGPGAMGPGWDATSIPYSHEGYLEAPGDYSPEPVPHPMDGNGRESLPVPPSTQEGDWEGDSEVIRSPEAAPAVYQTRWIPPQF